MKALSDITAKVTKENFSRKYIALGRIVNHWPEIIGEKLAAKTCPVKLHYRGKKDSKKPTQITLDIAVSSADATALHYQKDLILERMNSVFGEEWITAIKFVQTEKMPSATKIIKPKRQKPLAENEKEHLKAQLNDIEDEELLARLHSLGESVMMEAKQIQD